MKTFTLLSSIAFISVACSFAQAANIQIHCSNGDGTIKWREGKAGNRVFVSRLIKGRIAPLEIRDYRIELESEQSLPNTMRPSYLRKIRISRADGVALPEDVINLSKDRRLVEAVLICDETGEVQ